ncbi:hypothetical protein MNBD_ALPHA11-289 [hydrothermal vent metagenome]|uniref:Uncharacterized protein n=1 Tax=hydrothermal vent metagenome TaxID=652676 RepID=A0A3B0TSU2_9ZZZZ
MLGLQNLMIQPPSKTGTKNASLRAGRVYVQADQPAFLGKPCQTLYTRTAHAQKLCRWKLP